MKSFIFQVRCNTEFRLYDAVRTRQSGDTIVLSPKPKNDKTALEQGATVYLWEASPPQRGLIARGTVVASLTQNLPMPTWQHQFCKEPHQAAEARSTIRIDHIFNPPHSRESLRKNPILAEGNFFGAEQNPQGTIFHVKPKQNSAFSAANLEAALQNLK